MLENLAIYIIGYFSSLFFIYLLNKYYIEEDWMYDISKISLAKGLLISFLSWLFVVAIILFAIMESVKKIPTYIKLDTLFQSK